MGRGVILTLGIGLSTYFVLDILAFLMRGIADKVNDACQVQKFALQVEKGALMDGNKPLNNG